MGTEVATQQSAVPSLYDPKSQITAEDIQFPRLYVAQPGHPFVGDGIVKFASLVLASSNDDRAARTLLEVQDSFPAGEGIRFHVLGLRKSFSDDSTGELVRYQADAENIPSTAWVVYTYFIALPDIEEYPVKWIVTKSGKPAGTKINSVLMRQEAPTFTKQFLLTTKAYSNQEQGYRWAVPRVEPLDEPQSPADVDFAEGLYEIVTASAPSIDRSAADDGPEI